MKTIEGHAINIKDTLEVQSKLLDKIGEDVDKYDKQLGDLNEKMDKILASVGGPFKLVIAICVLVFLIIILFVVLFAIIQSQNTA